MKMIKVISKYMKTTIGLCMLAGLMACSNEESGGLRQDEAREIGISGAVITRAAGESRASNDGYQPLTNNPDYGTIHIKHTAEASYDGDAGDSLGFTANEGMLNYPSPPQYWYWNGATKHIFHAWTEPTDGNTQGDGKSLTGKNEDGTYWVNMEMNGQDGKPYDHIEGDSVRHRLSNLEYFIGAAKGPVTLAENGTVVRLDFEHLVAKIVILGIWRAYGAGNTEQVLTDNVKFYMPNMPKKAYWTTGIKDVSEWNSVQPEKPQVLPITDSNYSKNEEDYGVEGTLGDSTCFYIFPCKFADKNPLGEGEDYELGKIEFQYGDNWYFGSLANVTAVPALKAGECVALRLLLVDGTVYGQVPHIEPWNVSKNEQSSHDKPGIYDEKDWKRYIDWVKECETNESKKQYPPAGLFDEDGNLNLYCELDLRNEGGAYMNPEKLFPEGNNGVLKGNGHRIRTTDEGYWDKFADKLDDITIETKAYNKSEG